MTPSSTRDMESARACDTSTTREQLIGQRLRIGSIVLATLVALNGLLDAFLRPGGLLPVVWIYVADFALVGVVHILTRRPWGRTQAVLLAATATVLWNALFCSYAALSPDQIHALVAPSIVLTTATALLFPWGMLPQFVVSLVCVASYGAAFVFAGRPADLGALYAILSLVGAAVFSCVGAYVVEQHRRLIDQQTTRLQELNALMREAGVKKDEFLASVSHELRTPLNVVLGYIDLLLDHSFGPLEPAQRDILHRITKNASNLSHLINDLIDLSRIEAGRLKIEVASVELEPLFTDLRGVMDVLLAGHDVEFSASIATGCERVIADPDRLKQIVSNLLVNAVKFTERGTITLSAMSADDGRVAIAVVDTGIGIPATAQRAIFEPFRQVHDRSKRVPGAGIGLSISSRLALLMGGGLTVESEPGRGSRFTVVVPGDPGNDQGRSSDLFRKVS